MTTKKFTLLTSQDFQVRYGNRVSAQSSCLPCTLHTLRQEEGPQADGVIGCDLHWLQLESVDRATNPWDNLFEEIKLRTPNHVIHQYPLHVIPNLN